MKDTGLKIIFWILGLFLVAAPVLATIKSSDQCQQGVCVKIYDHRLVEPSDAMTYSGRNGSALFVYRFNEEGDLLTIFLAEPRAQACDREYKPARFDANYSDARGCIELNSKQSREFRVTVVSKSGGPERLTSLTNPTIWIQCSQSSFECDSQTSAPYQIKVLLRP